MKQYFLFTMVGLILAAIVLYFAWALIRACWQIYDDWRLGKELDELQSESEQRRIERETSATKRLANGCDHDFDNNAFGAFPDGVCRRCGLSQRRPPGFCDHVWRRKVGTEVGSICEKCGREHNAITAVQRTGL